ncbi:MAG: RraA family protein [Candidatus Limnocylindria bacterium]
MSRASHGTGENVPEPSSAGTLDLTELRSILTSALVADAMDALGLPARCLGWDIVPLQAEQVLVGRAFTVRQIGVEAPPRTPYRGLLRALDEIGPDEVFVIPTDRSTKAAVWGELVATASRHRGAAGALTDGLVRDSKMLRALDFPVFARGTTPLDTNGRLEITDVAPEAVIDDVPIRRGDLIVGDADGVIVVAWETAGDVVERVRAKLVGEAQFRRAVSTGTAPSVAFEQYRVL